MKYISIVMIWLLMSGCVAKTYTINQPSMIVIKSPKIRFADLGYLRKNGDEVRVDLYVAGQLIQSIEVDTLICVDEGCITKSRFNEEYLNAAYPPNLIKDVLLARPIFDAASLEELDNGFRQEIKSEQYNITYKIENGKIYFKDKTNRLLIKISKLKG